MISYIKSLFSRKEPKYVTELIAGDIVVIHNYHIGSWDGMIGIFVGSKTVNGGEFSFVRFNTDTVSLGFPKNCLLKVVSDIGEVTNRIDAVSTMVKTGSWKTIEEDFSKDFE